MVSGDHLSLGGPWSDHTVPYCSTSSFCCWQWTNVAAFSFDEKTEKWEVMALDGTKRRYKYIFIDFWSHATPRLCSFNSGTWCRAVSNTMRVVFPSMCSINSAPRNTVRRSRHPVELSFYGILCAYSQHNPIWRAKLLLGWEPTLRSGLENVFAGGRRNVC